MSAGESCCWVEGQGSLLHPAYSGVTLGLSTARRRMPSSSATWPGRRRSRAIPGHPLPPLAELVDLHERMSLPARKATVAAIALNTRLLDDDEAREAVDRAAAETGLVADDPVRFGPDRLLDAVLAAL